MLLNNPETAFIAYRHTGETDKTLRELLGTVVKKLDTCGVEAYTTFFAEDELKSKGAGPSDFMHHAFRKMDECDILFVVKHKKEHSEGMLMEVGYAIAKEIPIVVARQTESGYSYLADMTETSFEWTTLNDLERGIKAVFTLAN